MATGESVATATAAAIAAPEQSGPPAMVNGETTGIYITEMPEFVKTIQQAVQTFLLPLDPSMLLSHVL